MVTHLRDNTAHRLTIAVMQKGLTNLAQIMEKTELHATEHKSPLQDLLQSRLRPDMFTLLQQLQYVCYLAVDFAQHFTAKPAPRVGYDEKSWDELRKSIVVTLSYLDGIGPEQVQASIGKLVPTFMNNKKVMKAIDYAADVSVPDFHFHLVVAYGLLRHAGVPLGKSDYLGHLEMSDLPQEPEVATSGAHPT
jgi:uncharacterized protein